MQPPGQVGQLGDQALPAPRMLRQGPPCVEGADGNAALGVSVQQRRRDARI